MTEYEKLDDEDWFAPKAEETSEEERQELMEELGLNEEQFEEAVKQNLQFRTGPLAPIREKRYYEFYDTVFDTNAHKRLQQGTHVLPCLNLFGNINVGRRELSNCQLPGVLASDQTFKVQKLRSKVVFDASSEQAERLFALMEMSATFKLCVGDKPMFTGHLKWEDAHRAKDAPSLARAYVVDFGDSPIHIPARQNFNVEVEFSPELVAELNYFTRQKAMRVYLCGEQMRDVH